MASSRIRTSFSFKAITARSKECISMIIAMYGNGYYFIRRSWNTCCTAGWRRKPAARAQIAVVAASPLFSDCSFRENPLFFRSGARMVQRVTTVAFEGIEARAVDVQVQVVPGLPAFIIVGLPAQAVSEA